MRISESGQRLQTRETQDPSPRREVLEWKMTHLFLRTFQYYDRLQTAFSTLQYVERKIEHPLSKREAVHLKERLETQLLATRFRLFAMSRALHKIRAEKERDRANRMFEEFAEIGGLVVGCIAAQWAFKALRVYL